MIGDHFIEQRSPIVETLVQISHAIFHRFTAAAPAATTACPSTCTAIICEVSFHFLTVERIHYIPVCDDRVVVNQTLMIIVASDDNDVIVVMVSSVCVVIRSSSCSAADLLSLRIRRRRFVDVHEVVGEILG